MKTNKSNLTERLNQIAPHLQQHVMDYIDFLVERYSTKTPPENTQATIEQETPTETPEKEGNTEKESDAKTVTTAIEKPKEIKVVEEIKTIEQTPDTKNETASIEKTEIADRTIEVTSKEQNTAIEEEMPSVEDMQLDEKIVEIEEKKKNRILPDWRELKDAFLDKF